jgi:hypothetical protein
MSPDARAVVLSSAAVELSGLHVIYRIGQLHWNRTASLSAYLEDIQCLLGVSSHTTQRELSCV